MPWGKCRLLLTQSTIAKIDWSKGRKYVKCNFKSSGFPNKVRINSFQITKYEKLVKLSLRSSQAALVSVLFDGFFLVKKFVQIWFFLSSGLDGTDTRYIRILTFMKFVTSWSLSWLSVMSMISSSLVSFGVEQTKSDANVTTDESEKAKDDYNRTF